MKIKQNLHQQYLKNSWNLGLALCLGAGLILQGCKQSSQPKHQHQPVSPATSSQVADAYLTPSPSEQADVESSVDLEKVVVASKPWKIAFVSQDGPKGHENIAPDDCVSIVWCDAWQIAASKAKELGVELELAYVKEDCSEQDQCIRQQIELLNNLVERGDLQGMIVGPRDSNLLVPVIEKAIENNIAIISLATPINSEKVLTLATYNDFKGGKAVGEWVATQINDSGKILIIEGPKSQKNALDRRHGFIAGLQGKNITILDTEEALWSCEKAQEIVETWLAKYSEIDAIIAASDHMAIGALIATTTANRSDILVTGYDSLPAVQTLLESNLLGATIKQFPQGNSSTAVQLIVRHLETGETFPETVYLPNPLITSETISYGADKQSLPLAPKTLSCKL